MSKKKLFDEDSEEEVVFKTENEYAKKYDQWREKEEIHKLEQKYGPNADASGSSDSEDKSDEPPEVSEETEAQFLKTLALLKTKDPRIYDPNYKFFEDKEEKKEEEKPKTKTLTFEDSDEDDDDNDGNIFTIEKKAEIVNDKEVTGKKTSGEDSQKTPKEGKLKDYLTGKAEHIDEDVEKELAPLKALWSDPKLNEGEAFLRDYILNKRYLEEGDAGEAEDQIRDDEDLEEDEKRVEEQGKFERAYNFRFEEPDEEYLKRYPRTMNYIRPKDEKRSRKRAEVRARKEEEKRRKMEEIARLKAFKLKEIHDKLARIKEVTGNQELAFQEEDIEGDFDPEEHDRRMKALFDEQFYGEVDTEKPVFPDLDEELEIENWDNYEPEYDKGDAQAQDEDGPHCEDDDFNMDADYDPKQARANLLEQLKENMGKKRRNRKKKSKLASLLAKEKPKFVPAASDKTYAQYMEEYYKMDCEDVIGGDLPTRFKYREVVPNDYGLTVEEILLADDKELTQWVPLKKIVKHRPPDVERSEIKTYAQKAADLRLKKKMLPSLFKDLPEEPELVVPVGEAAKKKKKKKKKNKDQMADDDQTINNTDDKDHNAAEDVCGDPDFEADVSSENVSKKKKKKHKDTDQDVQNIVNVETNTESNVEKKSKKKKKHKDIQPIDNIETNIIQNTEDKEVKKDKEVEVEENNLDINIEQKGGKRKKKKYKSNGFVEETIQSVEPSRVSHDIDKEKAKKNNERPNLEVNVQNLKRKSEFNSDVPRKKTKNKNVNSKEHKKKFNKDKFKNKQNREQSTDNPLGKLSDERLKAYGLNPKKYRSFLKYKKF